MAKLPNRYGGGARTNENGLKFEQTTSLNEALIKAGFEIKNKYEVYKDNTLIGYSINKASFSTKFLRKEGINYLDINSKRWEPDEAFINTANSNFALE